MHEEIGETNRKGHEKVTAWVTKDAMSVGIIKVSGEVRHDVSSTMFIYRSAGDRYDTYVHGKEWHRTKQAALARAEEMRVKKIKALKKRLTELEALKFTAEE